LLGWVSTLAAPSLKPFYIPANTQFAFQLRWGITIYWATPVHESAWLSNLQSTLETDSIRILSWRWLSAESTQFVLSTSQVHLLASLSNGSRDVCIMLSGSTLPSP